MAILISSYAEEAAQEAALHTLLQLPHAQIISLPSLTSQTLPWWEAMGERAMVSLEHWALVAGGSGAAVGGLLAVVTQGPAGLGMYGDIFTGSVLLGLIGGLFFGSGAILLRVLIISLAQRHHQIRIIRLKRLLVVQVPVTQIEAMATRLQKTGAIEVNVRSTTQLREVLELSPTIGQ